MFIRVHLWLKKNVLKSLVDENGRITSGFFFWGFLVLAFGGSMIWAKSRDPFRRIEFTAKTAHYGKLSGITVLPKGYEKLPVVVFVHGSGGSWLTSGREIRQLAELGMAAVGFDYDQTNAAAFDEQFSGVEDYISQQRWAEPNSVAWIGFSLGAQNTLRYALKHPERQPRVYVRLAGGTTDEVRGEKGDGGGQNSEMGGNIQHSTSNIQRSMNLLAVRSQPSTLNSQLLLVHGQNDETFPVEDAKHLAESLRTNGTHVELKIVPNESHGFGADRAEVIRLIGEYCKAKLTPEHPLPEFPVLHPYYFLVCIAPAFAWAAFCFYSRRSREPQPKIPLAKWEIGLRVVAVVLAVAALVQTGVHLITPQMQVSENTLSIARKHLIPPKWMEDFEALAGMKDVQSSRFKVRGSENSQPASIWEGQKLQTLLTHVELANYNMYELVNWKVETNLYREFVLSPVIELRVDGGKLSDPGKTPDHSQLSTFNSQLSSEMNWRRELWETFYPRIRKENTTEAAAEIVVRFLRERVTIASSPPSDGGDGGFAYAGVETIWRRQIASPEEFEIIYVAALRSVGVPARLNHEQAAEFWTGTEWKPAPRPIAASWVGNVGP